MKRLLTTVLAIILLVAVLAGCSQTATTGPYSNPTTTAQPTQSTGKPQKADLKVFLSFPQYKEQIEKYLDQFIAKELADKNIDVTISLDMPPNDKSNEILRARLASGNSPDVFTLNPTADIPDYYKAGYLEDLSQQPFTANVFESVLDVCTMNGNVYALPLESSSWGYLYNKKMFTDLGLTPAKTLTEMAAVVAKLEGAGIKPFMLAYQDGWVAQLPHALAVQGTIAATQPDFVANMNGGTGSYADIAQIFDVFDLINKHGTDKPFEVGYMTGATDFANGKAAMWIMGTWAADPILTANPDFEFGCAPLPISNDPTAAMIMLSVSSGLAVSSDTDQKEVAMDLVNYFLDPDDSNDLFATLKWGQIAPFHTYSIFPWNDEAAKYVGEGLGHPEIKLPEAVSGAEAPVQMQSYAAGVATKEDVIAALDTAWANAVKAQG